MIVIFFICNEFVIYPAELSKKVEEKDAQISKLGTTLKETDNRNNDSRLKLAEFERRFEIKDAAINQLKTKVIELKSQLENAQMKEVELQRQLENRSRPTMGPPQPNSPNQHQQAAMAMMTMQLQKDIADCARKLKEKEQELELVSSERDGLLDSCTQLQEALQAAVSTLQPQIPPKPETEENWCQTDEILKTDANPVSCDENGIQTEPTIIANSVLVQFSSIDLQPVVVELPADYEPEPFEKQVLLPVPEVETIDSFCQYDLEEEAPTREAPQMEHALSQCQLTGGDAAIEKVDSEMQTEILESSENEVQTEEIINSECFVSHEEIQTQTEEEQVPVSVPNVCAATETESTSVFDCSTQSDIVIGDEMSVQTESVEGSEISTDCLDLFQMISNTSQTEVVTVQTQACDAGHSMFDLMDAVCQSTQLPGNNVVVQTDVTCNIENEQDEKQETVDAASDAEHSLFDRIDAVCQSPQPHFSNAVMQTEKYNGDIVEIITTDAASDAQHSMFSKKDAMSQHHTPMPESMSTFGCQVGQTVPELRAESPFTESVVSLSNDSFSITEPKSPNCPTEIDALRAAVRLLSREKRDLQSRLAVITRSSGTRSITPLTAPSNSSVTSSPIQNLQTSQNSTAGEGVHSSLSAIQRKIAELREQIAAQSTTNK